MLFHQVIARIMGQKSNGDWQHLKVDASGALQVTGGGGGTQYAEDTAHVSGDTGTLALVVRKDVLAADTSADGDYAALLTDVFGQLYVREQFSTTIATAILALQKTEDAAHVSGDSGIMALSVRYDAGGSLVDTDGDYAPLQVDSNGQLRVTGGGGGTEYNEDAVHASGAVGKVTLAVRSDIPAGLTDADGDYASLVVNALNMLWVEGRYDSVSASALSNIDGYFFAEDAAHASGNKGIQALAVRQDVLAALTNADGDYSSLLTNVFGELYVRESFSSAVATALQTLQRTEDAAHVTGDSGIMPLSVRQDVPAALADTDGDYQPLSTDIFGRLHVAERYSSTIATDIESLSKAEDAAHTSGDLGMMMFGIRKDEPASLASDSLDYTPFQTDSLGNIRTTSYVTGDVAHDAADAGNPIKVGGKARTANPTAVAANDRVDAGFDVLGRQIMTPVQIRGLRQTAYVALSNGTETALLTGSSGVYHDLMYIMCSNDSSVAVSVTVRASTGGNAQMVIEVPATGTAGVSLPVPLPQDHADASWTVDMADITGTNVYISALFSKEA